MWWSRQSARRKAIRSELVESAAQQRSRLRGSLNHLFVLAGSFFILATALLIYRGEPLPYTEGDQAPSDLLSPVSFSVKDPEQTERLRESARAATGPVLLANPQAWAELETQLMALPLEVKNLRSPDQLTPKLQARWPQLSASALTWLHNVSEDRNLQHAYGSMINLMLGYLRETPLVDDATFQLLHNARSDRITLVMSPSLDGPLQSVSRQVVIKLSDTPTLQGFLSTAVARSFPQELAPTLLAYLQNFQRPTFRYDPALTDQLVKRSMAAVRPSEVLIRENQRLVSKGQTITGRDYMLLKRAEYERERQRHESHPWDKWLRNLGQAIMAGILTAAGTLYATWYLKREQRTVKRGWALVGLLLVSLSIAKLSVTAGLWNHIYLMGTWPVLLTGIILVLAFDQRFALGLGALHGLLVTMALGQGLEFYITMLAGLLLFVFSLRDIRTRGKLIETGIWAGAVLFTCVWALGLAQGRDVETLARHSLWAATSGVMVAFLTLGLLPLIERVFQITTAMTLLELCDANQPLLRQLATEAPGTFNHSLVLGTLAEAAADTVGANGLLCRVGAYYHDIGKLSKPHYFIENLSGEPNRHNKLSPAMSLLIIVGHVKDGLELAREYHLPAALWAFIGEHHGTTLVEYFYNAARERQPKDDTPVSDADFRYAGPKPQTRETAILMICDGVEGTIRSMREPTPGRIESVVHQMIMKRLMDGQFSECDLTLQDLSTIESALVRTLAGVYHGRVAYPKVQIA